MKTILAIILAALATVSEVAAQPQIVSIALSGANQTNTVQIASFQYVKVLTAVDTLIGNPAGTSSQLGIANSWLDVSSLSAGIFGIPHTLDRNGDFQYGVPGTLVGLTVAGPVGISVRTGSTPRTSATPVFVTLEICPSAYSVTNSVTLGPGQGASINLEESTDLIQWTPTTNGVYTAQSAMFFRLNLQRAQ
jgi:hypothetical protein